MSCLGNCEIEFLQIHSGKNVKYEDSVSLIMIYNDDDNRCLKLYLCDHFNINAWCYILIHSCGNKLDCGIDTQRWYNVIIIQ